MRRFAEVVRAVHPELGRGPGGFDVPGYGAAGGLGMALAVFLGARMRSGIEELLSWYDFDAALEGADLVVTGEGKLDFQSLDGKAVSGVVAHAARKGVPAAVICGKLELDAGQLETLGAAYVLEAGKGQRLATEATNRAATQIQEYFAGKRVLFDVPLDAGGTPFQREVWAEVCDIPYGQSCTAADVANSLGKSGSHRSIGTAIRRNPVPILIPTHRVDLPNATGRIAKIFRALRALEQSNTPY